MRESRSLCQLPEKLHVRFPGERRVRSALDGVETLPGVLQALREVFLAEGREEAFFHYQCLVLLTKPDFAYIM